MVKKFIFKYISHETFTFDNRDLPQITKSLKQLILYKTKYIKIMLTKTKILKYLINFNVSKTN